MSTMLASATTIDFASALAGLAAEPAPALPQWRTWAPEIVQNVDPEGDLLQGQAASSQQGTAAVFGLGGVGGRTWLQLVRLRIGSLIGIDPDRYGQFSWKTQPAEPDHNGQAKAWVLGDIAHRIHPGTRIRAAVGMAQDVPLSLLRQADILLAAGDNIELMVWAGTIAAALGKPLIQGAVHGVTHSAIVRAYDLRDPNGVCPACALTAREWATLKARQGCDPSLPVFNGEATRTSPVLCSLASDLQTGEAVKWLEGRERDALRGEELVYCQLNHKPYRSRLSRSAKCRCPHERWHWQDLPASAAAAPLGEVVASALGAQARHNPLLQIRAEPSWRQRVRCPSCGKVTEIGRFARPDEPVGRCDCGQRLRAGSMSSQSVIPGADLRAALGKTLFELGLGAGAAVGLSEGDGWTYLVLPGDPIESLCSTGGVS